MRAATFASLLRRRLPPFHHHELLSEAPAARHRQGARPVRGGAGTGVPTISLCGSRFGGHTEQVHLLISGPGRGNPSTVIQVLKQSFARRLLRLLRKRRDERQGRSGNWRWTRDTSGNGAFMISWCGRSISECRNCATCIVIRLPRDWS